MTCGVWEAITDQWQTITTKWEDIGVCGVELLGGGGEWRHGGYNSASDSYRLKKELLKEVEQEIAVIERKEKPLVKKAKRNTDAEIKLLALRDEINALRLEREALLRMIDDEEAIFILLAATPFN